MPSQKVDAKTVAATADKLDELHESGELADIISDAAEVHGTEDGAVLGFEYELGGVRIPPIRPGIIVMLDMIDSPLMDENVAAMVESGEISISDTLCALYLIVIGREAADPLMGIAKRTKEIEKLKPMAEKSELMFRAYMDKLDEINKCYGQFQADAVDFYDEFENVTPQEILSLILLMLNDAFSSWALASTDDAGGGRKK